MQQPGDERVLDLEFPAEPQFVHQARERFEEFIRPSKLDAEELQAVKVSLSEACSNAVCHGSPRAASNTVRLRCVIDQGCLTIEVTDQGGGFRPREIALPEFEEWKPSGRGLFLMQALMDSVEFLPAPDGTCVRLVKQLSSEGAGGSGSSSGESPIALRIAAAPAT